MIRGRNVGFALSAMSDEGGSLLTSVKMSDESLTLIVRYSYFLIQDSV